MISIITITPPRDTHILWKNKVISLQNVYFRPKLFCIVNYEYLSFYKFTIKKLLNNPQIHL